MSSATSRSRSSNAGTSELRRQCDGGSPCAPPGGRRRHPSLKAGSACADLYRVNVVPFVVIPPAADRPKLGSILVRKGWLSPEQLESALTAAVQQKQRLGEVLLKLGWTTEERIAKALAEQLGLAYMDPYSASLDPTAVARLPKELAAKHCVLPIRSIDANTVVVAVADPTDSEGLGEVQAGWAVSSASSSPSGRRSSTR